MDNHETVSEEHGFQVTNNNNQVDQLGNTSEEDEDEFEDASDSGTIGHQNGKIFFNHHNQDEDNETDNFEDAQEELSPEEIEENRQKAIQFKDEGNECFRDGKYEEADDLYSKGLLCCPLSCHQERSVLYSNRAAARFHLIPSSSSEGTNDLQTSENEESLVNPSSSSLPLTRKEVQDQVISDCTHALTLNPSYLKPLLKRAEVYRDYSDKDAKLDECLTDLKRILELKNSNEVKQQIMQVEIQIQERNERLKDEMLGKLKDLGNLVLKPFGLSTNNFEMNPNESGGYSLNFKPNNK